MRMATSWSLIGSSPSPNLLDLKAAFGPAHVERRSRANLAAVLERIPEIGKVRIMITIRRRVVFGVSPEPDLSAQRGRLAAHRFTMGRPLKAPPSGKMSK
jgi:hypothetical protein